VQPSKGNTMFNPQRTEARLQEAIFVPTRREAMYRKLVGHYSQIKKPKKITAHEVWEIARILNIPNNKKLLTIPRNQCRAAIEESFNANIKQVDALRAEAVLLANKLTKIYKPHCAEHNIDPHALAWSTLLLGKSAYNKSSSTPNWCIDQVNKGEVLVIEDASKFFGVRENNLQPI
jgi:hypothetical protein